MKVITHVINRNENTITFDYSGGKLTDATMIR